MMRSVKECTMTHSGVHHSALALTEHQVRAFFDEQLMGTSSVTGLIENAALFADSAVARVHADGTVIAHDRFGVPREHTRPSTASSLALDAAGEVWVDGLDGQLAALFLARLSLAVQVIERWSTPRDDARAPIDVLIERTSSKTARGAALAQLSLSHDSAVRVVVCTGPVEQVERLIDVLASTQRLIARTTHNDRTVLLLAVNENQALELGGVPRGVRAAHGHIVAASDTYIGFVNAADAHRFSRPSPAEEGPYRGIDAVWLNGARVSSLTALAHLNPRQLAHLPDVRGLDRLVERHGERILQVLEAYATTESMRKASALLYMHHNSVMYWVQKAEAELGYSLAEPYQRALLFISLCLHRIARGDD